MTILSRNCRTHFLHYICRFSRSPRKREANTSPKRGSIILETQLPSKKAHVEKVDETGMGSFFLESF